MKYEEKECDLFSYYDKGYYLVHCISADFKLGAGIAISALEKQIPKKPVMGYAFTEKIREVIKRTDPERAESKTECCPVCGSTLGVSQFVKAQTGLRFGDSFCKRCGQAIDWEEDER